MIRLHEFLERHGYAFAVPLLPARCFNVLYVPAIECANRSRPVLVVPRLLNFDAQHFPRVVSRYAAPPNFADQLHRVNLEAMPATIREVRKALASVTEVAIALNSTLVIVGA